MVRRSQRDFVRSDWRHRVADSGLATHRRLGHWRGGLGHRLFDSYARFLDYAAKRALLRQVGGGYIFRHRLLQAYFANLVK